MIQIKLAAMLNGGYADGNHTTRGRLLKTATTRRLLKKVAKQFQRNVSYKINAKKYVSKETHVTKI